MGEETLTDQQGQPSNGEGLTNRGGGIDPSQLRLSQNFHEGLGVKKRHTLIQVRKPGKQEYIRVHPDPEYSLQTALLEFKEDGETYLVAPPFGPGSQANLSPKSCT